MDGGKSCRTAGKVSAGFGRGRTCRLRRRFEIAVLWGLANFGARRFPKGERKALWCARRRILIAPAGLTRRLRRRRWGCRPVGGSTFFRSERKYQRKHAARRLREKGFYCPFCRRGSQCRAQWSWPAFAYGRSALVLAFFRRQNGRAFFPSLPIAALLPRSWRGAYSNGGAWDASLQLGYFCDVKCQRGFETTLAFLCEPEGLSPDGGLSYSADKEITPDRRAARPGAERR